ncbi:MAG: DUF5622 domain-containing protein [Desulfurococcaceae archaeon]
MGLKHRKYIYVKRSDGVYVKVRVLNLRFGTKIEQVNITDPSRYIVLNYKTTKPPRTAIIINEDILPAEVKSILYST